MTGRHFTALVRNEHQRWNPMRFNAAECIAQRAGHGKESLGTRQRAPARIAVVALRDARKTRPQRDHHELSEQGRANMLGLPERQSSPGKYGVREERSSNRHQTKSACTPRRCLFSGSAWTIWPDRSDRRPRGADARRGHRPSKAPAQRRWGGRSMRTCARCWQRRRGSISHTGLPTPQSERPVAGDQRVLGYWTGVVSGIWAVIEWHEPSEER